MLPCACHAGNSRGKWLILATFCQQSRCTRKEYKESSRSSILNSFCLFDPFASKSLPVQPFRPKCFSVALSLSLSLPYSPQYAFPQNVYSAQTYVNYTFFSYAQQNKRGNNSAEDKGKFPRVTRIDHPRFVYASHYTRISSVNYFKHFLWFWWLSWLYRSGVILLLAHPRDERVYRTWYFLIAWRLDCQKLTEKLLIYDVSTRMEILYWIFTRFQTSICI